jgi:hypothetical protein
MSQENLSNNNSDNSVDDTVNAGQVETFDSQTLANAQEAHATELLKPKEQKRYTLSEQDKNAGIELCNTFIDSLMQVHLPESLKKSEDIQNVIALQQAMERFTLASMFKIVIQAVKALDKFDIDDCYDEMGSFDVHRLQVFMNMQGHIMSTVANFNMHVRQLPGVLRSMIQDAEMTNAYVVEIAPTVQSSQPDGTTEHVAMISKLPMNILMSEAMQELNESNKDYDGTEDDFAGVTAGRIDTGELDAVGNPIYRYENTELIDEDSSEGVIQDFEDI